MQGSGLAAHAAGEALGEWPWRIPSQKAGALASLSHRRQEIVAGDESHYHFKAVLFLTAKLKLVSYSL